MITVPFEQLGAGQVGRLAYQVIGRDGPVFNPQNIRYLRPQDALTGPPPASPFELATAISGINLLVSAGTLALSAQVLQEVRRISRQLERIVLKLDLMDSKLDQILEKVEVIDTKVSENNLRHALTHILQTSLQSDEINIAGLARAGRDLETFTQSVRGFQIGGALGLRISTDIVFNLELIFGLLSNLRCLVLMRHNESALGDPRRVVALDSVEDYLGHTGTLHQIKSILAADKVMIQGIDALRMDVKNNFTFAGDGDFVRIASVYDDTVRTPLLATFDPLSANIWKKYFEYKTPADADIVSALNEYRQLWLWHSDAGLVWRTLQELDWVRSGYSVGKWRNRLADSPLQATRKLDVDCEIPAMAA
jgi:hypothetical protein